MALRILLIEPEYRKASHSHLVAGAENHQKRDDEALWYPPLGLMKLSTFHKNRGDYVEFAIGCRKKIEINGPFSDKLWDRIYITSLFTFDWSNLVKTVDYYRAAVGGSTHKIFIGGIMASILPNEVFEETGIYPITGILNSPKKIGLEGDENIDLLPPDYSLVDGSLYAVNDTYYGYTTRGCVNVCAWCGVPCIEPDYVPYIDIKPMIRILRAQYGDKPKLKLMDNNVLPSPHLEQIVADLIELGYGRGKKSSDNSRKARVIDFNQGLDSLHMTEANLALLSKLHIKPMRVAFDRIGEKAQYEKALRLAQSHGFREFSNYMLYNCDDTPRDLYERLQVNLRLNDEWRGKTGKTTAGVIYSYPMRFAPIRDPELTQANRARDYDPELSGRKYDHLQNAKWNRKFTRNIEIIKGAAHGMISPTPDLARRAVGEDYETYIANLYMPEELLRNRNKYEKRFGGDGKVEKFRKFMLKLLRKQDNLFLVFHRAVSQNTKSALMEYLETCTDKEVRYWLEWYPRR